MAGFVFVGFLFVAVAAFGRFFFLTCDEDGSGLMIDDNDDSSGNTGCPASAVLLTASEAALRVMEFGPVLDGGMLDEAITSLVDKKKADAPINLAIRFADGIFLLL